MKRKIGSGGAPQQTINLGECAAIVCATEDNGSFVAGLLTRAIATHERGLPGRMPA